MNTQLFDANTPWAFWQCQPNPPENVWHAAVQSASPLLDLTIPHDRIDLVLEQTLGEGRFGPDHWKLKSSRRLYYMIKPLLPKPVTSLLKQASSRNARKNFPLHWPLEDRYARFLWGCIRQVLIQTGQEKIAYRHFWPDGAQYALVLTHDIENHAGQKFVSQVADLEERLGFRSSFNFVPERYPVDQGLVTALRGRGFEIGIHGLNHDGKDFNSEPIFYQRAKRINHYLKTYQAVGYRSPLTHRNPAWMQALELDYDSSFFDTDPFEPMPGGSMSIWPYQIGRFIELPYTLIQDSTLAFVLGESTPRLWLDKLTFLRQYHGMALLNSHPDYLLQPAVLNLYETFLREVKQVGQYWNALPRQAARWWRFRTYDQPSPELPAISHGFVAINNDGAILC